MKVLWNMGKCARMFFHAHKEERRKEGEKIKSNLSRVNNEENSLVEYGNYIAFPATLPAIAVAMVARILMLVCSNWMKIYAFTQWL